LTADTDIEILGLGVVVPDVKRRQEITADDPWRGKLRILDAQPDVTEAELQQADLGGLGNWAPVLATLGFRTGAMGYVGDDAAGRIYGQRLQGESGVSNLLIRTKYTTAVSLITVDHSGERKIGFYPGANQYFDFEPDVLSGIEENRPKIAHVAYAGLCQHGFDRNGGKNLADGISAMREMGIFTSVDTHTIDDYSILEPALGVVDLFACNFNEAAAICGGQTLPFGAVLEEAVKDLGQRLGEAHLRRRPGLRIFGVTTDSGAYVMFQDSRGRVDGDYVRSRYASLPAVDKTGAGDSQRAGLHAYLLANWEKVRAGELGGCEIASAFQLANLAATLNIQGRGVSGFRGAKYGNLADVVDGGQSYKTGTDLYTALRV